MSFLLASSSEERYCYYHYCYWYHYYHYCNYTITVTGIITTNTTITTITVNANKSFVYVPERIVWHSIARPTGVGLQDGLSVCLSVFWTVSR